MATDNDGDTYSMRPSSSSSKSSSLQGAESSRKPLQSMVIPPLPSSTAGDKENREQPENAKAASSDEQQQRKRPASFFGKHVSSTADAPMSGPLLSKELSQDAARSSVRDSPSPHLLAQTYSQGNKRRVLRYGETLESLFCLSNHTPYEHRRFCQDIADGPLADDPAAWRRVLKVASARILGHEAAERGSDLIRLHRRATSRFSPFSEHKDVAFEQDVLALWLSYARAQSSFGSMEEARLTFRHIQNQRLGVTIAEFYLSLAEFEKKQDDVERAKHTLRTGLGNNAEPRQTLEDALAGMDGKLDGLKDQEGGKSQSPVRIAAKAAAGVPPLPMTRSPTAPISNKRKSEHDTSPKRLKKNDGTPLEFGGGETVSTSINKKATSQDTTSDNLNLTPVAPFDERHPRMRPATIGVTGSRSASKVLDNKPEMVIKKNGSASKPLHESSALKPLSLTSTKSTNGRPPLLTKTPRLLRAGLRGKPQRVDPEKPLQTDSEDDSSMDTASRSETLDVSSLLENVTERPEEAKPKKAPKLNLDYMMNWDPTSRRGRANDTTKGDRPSAPAARASMLGRTRTPNMEPIEETSAGPPSSVPSNTAASAGSGSSVVTASLHSNTHRSDGSNESRHSASDRTSQSLAATETDPKGELPSTTTSAVKRSDSLTSPDMATLMTKANRHFLPLVCESNILRVNTVPYAKLGVIGKGGSCKVYRALSKDCSIVAIKKVKLGGMDKKATSGYANEIALLKRLRGNPAIIQLYDSEVDLSRKAIFVVMELGEVDLNQVIQQQTLHDKSADSERSRSALDMNFIRLTWQQMLKAVHCIHEERIIHGDLKPANFLFVRGALKLIDFGIAKAIQSDDTTNIYRDSQIGTLNYMSPEAILDTGSGKNGARMRIGRASDIWSLGCILYQMVYGKTPFAELHMIQKLQAIVNPSFKINFPDGVEDSGAVNAIQLCLRRNADDRPPIVGPNGLLNEHYFLNTRQRSTGF